MEEIVVYVHGKGGSAQEAEHYKALFPDCEVIGFDYHAQSPWEATEEFSGFFTAVRKRCGKLTLVANSIGAFLSLSSLNEKLVDTAYFISPVVDMEQLICNMMQWADVSEAELAEKQEISTTFGETLSWKYLCYVREHPISWKIPTRILYGGKGCSDLYGNHKSLCGKEQRRADRYAGRRALVSYKGADAISGSLDKE